MAPRQDRGPVQVRPLDAERRRARRLLVLAVLVLVTTGLVALAQGFGLLPWS